MDGASEEEQIGLIRAHPELAGKAAIAGELTAESTNEQAKSGLNQCSAGEYATLHKLNADYKARFGFPFILAVKGPDGNGLTRAEIIATFTRRLKHQRQDEMAECLRQIHRIAELRLNDLLKVKLDFGNVIMGWAEIIGEWSDVEDNLTCAYMTRAHQRTASQLADWMRACGMETHIDAVGNVVGRYHVRPAECENPDHRLPLRHRERRRQIRRPSRHPAADGHRAQTAHEGRKTAVQLRDHRLRGRRRGTLQKHFFGQ